MLVREKDPYFVVLGTKGSFIKYGMDTQEENLKSGLIPKKYILNLYLFINNNNL